MAVELGIDFGTTRTVVATCDRGNYPVVGFVTPDGASLEFYPSIVAEREGDLLFGLDALAPLEERSSTVVRSFKRILSDPGVSPSRPVVIGGAEIDVLELITRFLAALRRDLGARSNLPSPPRGGESMRCVVATPANSHSAQRFITLEAFRRAGFDVVAMLNEPSAAGLEYAHRYRNTITARREHILVYDLGGGTFDASLVRMSGKSHDVVASNGVARLGGDDFDETLAEIALEQRKIESDSVPPSARSLLIDQCRDAKERVTPNSKRIAIDLAPCLERPGEDLVSIPIEHYYERCAPLVEKTIATMKRVLSREDPENIYNRESASSPGLEADDVAGIYVVGGASSLPIIARMLKEEFGARRVHRSAYPSGATAIGLAIAMDHRAGFELTERFSHHFGVFREALDGAEVAFDPIFTERTEQPKWGDEAHASVRMYRAAHNVGHFRYVECGWLDDRGAPSGDITPFAEVLFPFDPELRRPGVDLRGVPVLRTPGGPLVEERYLVCAGGVVELVIRDLETGYECRHRLG